VSPCLQEFKTTLLEQGLVDRVEVANKTKAKVGSGAQYRGDMCPSYGGQVPSLGGSDAHYRKVSAHYRGVRCPS